jgi:hypothetical protein
MERPPTSAMVLIYDYSSLHLEIYIYVDSLAVLAGDFIHRDEFDLEKNSGTFLVSCAISE